MKLLLMIVAASLLLFGCAAQQPSAAACPIDESACGSGTVFNNETCKCDAVAAAPPKLPPPSGDLQPPAQNATNDSQASDEAASGDGTVPSSTTQNVERTGTGVAPNASGSRQPSGQISCSLRLDPEVINPGDYTLVSYDTYSEMDVKFQYNCGEQVITISNGGLVSGAKLCQFNKIGVQKVRITAGGATCAEANLTVGQEAPSFKNCYVNQSSIRRNLVDYYYEARVQFSGVSSGDVLSWQCDNTIATKTLREAPGFGMPLYEDIYCDYPSQPERDYIQVSIGGFSCGSIPTR